MWQTENFSKWYQLHEKKILADFFTLLRFPSISAQEKHFPDVLKTADWLFHFLKNAGLKPEIWKTKGQPVVFAEKISKDPKAKTLLFYGHYDVQPPDPLDLWKTPPFEPSLREGAVYARGALDNKGQMFYTLTAISAFLQMHPNAPLSIKLFLEGEEESGGEGTEEALIKYKSRLHADELYVVDFDIKGAKEPSINLGSRGIFTAEMTVSTAKTDLHSGTHGGIALSPLRVMAGLVSSLWDEKGRINIPEFYKNITPLLPKEKKAIDWTFNEKKYFQEFGVRAFAAEKGFSLSESNWIRPCLEVHGISGGYSGEGFKTVIPKMASAKISCRLALGQKPATIAKQLKNHFKKQLPKKVAFEFKQLHAAEAFFTSSAHPCVQKAKAALENVFQKKCVFILCGASVPIVPLLQKACGAEVCLLGLGLATDDIHAPNEHFELSRFFKGFMVIAQILCLSAEGKTK